MQPAGFAVHTRTSPATRGWEPLYASTETGVYRLAIQVAQEHSNSRGMLHGGVIATLADNSCGLSLGLAIGGSPQGIVTTSLAVDYIGAARIGQWLVVTPRVVKAGKSSGVVDAIVSADDDIVARANASFRILG
jgi:uncharacterized protein (TIGR00369 family)